MPPSPLAGQAGTVLVLVVVVVSCGVLVGTFAAFYRRYRMFTRGLRGTAMVVDVRPTGVWQQRSVTEAPTDTVVVATAAMPRGVPVNQKVPHGQYQPGQVVPVVQAPGRPDVVLLDRPDLERPVWAVYLPLVLLVAAPVITFLGLSHRG
ncbi:MAG: hypothetical protein BGO38_14975 [Cellulomonas sp. 73-145]|uniref:hypothetical protein n=1 Tax=Cellulomonas sp. 73-145 TaxID=1895739 RepID=UPI00092AC3B8|nr:hypothetical protein [Cellulomonas sp. 73-145]MBN9326891.1 hypothetical protein [Cellulomonas sp.]OJV58696.1 MAG: hypothetical protein BGO38_14975 [Cellulomonas sp. 73-145]